MTSDLERLWREEQEAGFEGWDFSHLDGRWSAEGPPWSYTMQVREVMGRARSVLDLGTGGGERLLGLRDGWPARVVATEVHPRSVVLAAERLTPAGAGVVACRDAVDTLLPFSDGSFDLVLNRHAAFNAREVFRVLRPGGTFLTQQVAGDNLADLSDRFGCVQPWTFFDLAWARNAVVEAGFDLRDTRDWRGPLSFADTGAVVYFLRAIPWVVPGFDVETHRDALARLEDRRKAGDDLVFHEHRFLLRATKA